MWLHPQVAAIDCADCCRRLYDLDTGKPKSFLHGPKREERFYEGPRYAPACLHGVECPKGSPELAKHRMPNWRNIICMRAWRRLRAGAKLGTIDAIAADNFALLSELWETIAASKQSKRLVRDIQRSLR